MLYARRGQSVLYSNGSNVARTRNQKVANMTDEERIEMKMQYIHKIAQAKGISYQDAYKLAVVKEYLKYADTVTEINRQ